MLKPATAALLACLTSATLAQGPDPSAAPTRMNQLVQSYVTAGTFMGTVLVSRDGQILLDKGYGSANLDWAIPNAPNVKFRLGSLTKQFTAALILLEQQDGKLSIADPVSKYLPDCPKAWEKITIAELLGHTAGIPNFTADPTFKSWSQNPRSSAELLAYFDQKPLDFDPGSKYSYSNSNFEVLGVILEKVSGKTYNELLQARLFAPLDMRDTGLDGDDLVLPRRALGYYAAAHPGGAPTYAHSESMTIPWAAGSLYSTTHDLLAWEDALFGGKVLSPMSLKLMTTPGKGDYGLGVGVSVREGQTIVAHGGGIEGFSTRLLDVPEKRITIVVLSNVAGGAPGTIADQLLDIALGKSASSSPAPRR